MITVSAFQNTSSEIITNDNENSIWAYPNQ